MGVSSSRGLEAHDDGNGCQLAVLAGDDAGAKRKVGAIVEDFGWAVVDLGGIASARYLEPMCLQRSPRGGPSAAVPWIAKVRPWHDMQTLTGRVTKGILRTLFS